MAVISDATQAQIEGYLVSDGIVTKDDIQQLKQDAKTNGKPFLAEAVASGKVSNEQLTNAIALATNMPYVNLSTVRVKPEVLDLLPEDVAERCMAVPIGEINHRLVVAMLDADNVQAVDFLSNKIGRPLKVYVASEEGIRHVLKQYEMNVSKEMAGALADLGEQGSEVTTGTAPNGTSSNAMSIEALVQDSPVSKALSTILEFAAKNSASDIHIEPLEHSLKIRCRIDGILRELMQLPKNTEAPFISRIKILANMKIDEHRVPQDGDFSISVSNKSIDLRVSVSPVVWGEQVVIRLLDKNGISLKLEDMGYRGPALKTIRSGLTQTHGMVLTSGPTGSGKTTSMYALLQEILDDSINIVTLEDPVEYKISGVNQIQVNGDVGLNFASGLRSVLRQDPDVVMVGEIRDRETAELAVQAALTGHLVFSTLHTNSAAGILPRLLDMGIEPYLIASTVHTVIGQRLLRRNTKQQETYEADPAEIASIQATLGHLLPKNEAERLDVAHELGYESLPLSTDNAYTLTKGIVSPESPDGFSGRLGIYEVFQITDEIQKLILQRATATDMQKMAQQQGMISMREDGYLKALAGLTTLSEVNRVAASENA